MAEPSNRIDLESQLSILYRIILWCGLLPFKFDSLTRQLRPSINLSRFAITAYRVLKYTSCLRLWLTIGTLLFYYVNIIKTEFIWRSFQGQERVLLLLCSVTECASTFIIASKLLEQGNDFVRAINKLIQTSDFIGKRVCDTRLCCPLGLEASLSIKVIISIYQLVFYTPGYLLKVIVNFDFLAPYGALLLVLTFWSHLYSQIVLISLYTKMTAYIESFPKKILTRQEFVKRIRPLLVVSFRIHRLKVVLDMFFSSLFVAAYFKLFIDIADLYNLLKIVVYHGVVHTEDAEGLLLFRYYVCFGCRFAMAMSASYDIFLIGRLSDMLINVAKTFQSKILVLMAIKQKALMQSPRIEKKVNLFLIQSIVFDLNSRMYHQFKIDQQFSLDYLLKIVIVYVITCLQYYASEAVYTKSI